MEQAAVISVYDIGMAGIDVEAGVKDGAVLRQVIKHQRQPVGCLIIVAMILLDTLVITEQQQA